jgi:polar amino acid transport system substrate-binding protein
MNNRLSLTATGLLAVLIVIAGCGGKSNSTTTQSASSAADPKLVAAVPANLKGKSVVIGTDATLAPMEFTAVDGKTIQGVDVDLGTAILAKLGLTADFQATPFENLIPGVQSGRFGLAMSSVTDKKEREKLVDFVTYLNEGSTIYTAAGGPKVATLRDLCGLTAGAEKGTIYQDQLEKTSASCPAGKKISIKLFLSQTDVVKALEDGRVQASVSDTPIAQWSINQSNGKVVAQGKEYGIAPYGIVLPKGSPLAAPIKDALAALIADGTYGTILKKWGLTSGEVKQPKINGAVS